MLLDAWLSLALPLGRHVNERNQQGRLLTAVEIDISGSLTSDQNAQARTQRCPASRLFDYSIMDHFPTNWGRPVS